MLMGSFGGPGGAYFNRSSGPSIATSGTSGITRPDSVHGTDIGKIEGKIVRFFPILS
jgi:hypothetical protein